MTSRDFVYWLQGAFEVGGLTSLDKEQVKIVRNHINMVYVNEIDPSFGEAKQQALNDAHEGKITFRC